MNSIRAGVKEITSTGFPPSEDNGEAVGSMQVHWVEVDGVRVPGNVLDVAWNGNGEDFHTVTVRWLCSKFETVPMDSEPA